MKDAMMKVAGVLFLMLAAVSIWAQTGVPVGQLQGTPSATGMIYVVMPDGTAKTALLGAGLQIVMISGVPTIVPTIPVPQYATETLTAGGTTKRDFVLKVTPKAGTLKVYQNGLRQSEGTDYTLTGQTITFISYYGDMTAARVIADYEKP